MNNYLIRKNLKVACVVAIAFGERVNYFSNIYFNVSLYMNVKQGSTRRGCGFEYRISLNTRPYVYFFQDNVDPALKRGRRINGAGVFFLLTGLGMRYFNYYFNYYYGEPRILR